MLSPLRGSVYFVALVFHSLCALLMRLGLSLLEGMLKHFRNINGTRIHWTTLILNQHYLAKTRACTSEGFNFGSGKMAQRE